MESMNYLQTSKNKLQAHNLPIIFEVHHNQKTYGFVHEDKPCCMAEMYFLYQGEYFIFTENLYIR